MIRDKLKQKMLSDPRLQVPLYEELSFWLDQDCQDMIELVNDTNNISVLLFDPIGKVMQDRLGFKPDDNEDDNDNSCTGEDFEPSGLRPEWSKHELHELNEYDSLTARNRCGNQDVEMGSRRRSSDESNESCTGESCTDGTDMTGRKCSLGGRSREEIEFLVNTNKDFYRMSPEEKAAMDLSDTCYAEAAYQMDACFLEWLLRDSLKAL